MNGGGAGRGCISDPPWSHGVRIGGVGKACSMAEGGCTPVHTEERFNGENKRGLIKIRSLNCRYDRRENGSTPVISLGKCSVVIIC